MHLMGLFYIRGCEGIFGIMFSGFGYTDKDGQVILKCMDDETLDGSLW